MAFMFLFVRKLCVFVSAFCVGGHAQVFVHPDVQAQMVTPVVKNDNLVTQTVYGFLDFTTTIGNTVMVFSPQSSSVAVTGFKVVSSCYI